MTITEFAEVVRTGTSALPEDRPVKCAQCLTITSAVMIAESGYLCPGCLSQICVMCGCTTYMACVGGCYWVTPGICSSHETELKQLANEVFAAAL